MMYILGLDLGQSVDPTALVILRTEQADRYDLGHLERLPLGMTYPDIVDHVADLLGKFKPRPHLVVDATGGGRPVVDMFEVAGLEPYAITCTAGHVVTQGDKPREWNVPKRDLVSAAKVALQARCLRIAAGLDLVDVLVAELKNFKVKITLAGNDTYEAWRSGDHDDIVLALSIALWAGENLRLGPPTWGRAPEWNRNG